MILIDLNNNFLNSISIQNITILFVFLIEIQTYLTRIYQETNLLIT